MSEQELIKDICQREIKYGCYNIKIDNIPIYFYIRRYIRQSVTSRAGFHENLRSNDTSRRERIKTYFISLFQILWIIILKKKYTNFIFPFYRQEKVNGIYVEKFTDPIIEFSSIKDSYIIFEWGRKGRHYSPRIHQQKVIYNESIYILKRLISKFYSKKFFKSYKDEINNLVNTLQEAFPEIKINSDYISRQILYQSLETRIYKNLFKRMRIKNFIAPSRADFLHIIPAAKQCNIPVYELQHGITHAETLTYSGYKDPFFTPDYFLAFGDMSKTDKYGVDIEKIKVIGFAFNDYLQLINKNDSTISSSDVLLVSDPNISDKMISVCLILAEAHPSTHFYYRAHPAEILTEVQKKKLLTLKNIHLDDNTVNLLVVLQRFTHVLGENSTAIYEALSMGKKVGKLYMEGLSPKDIDKDDSDYFWRIEDADSFKEFINASPEAKKQRKIYSKFDRKLFEDLIAS